MLEGCDTYDILGGLMPNNSKIIQPASFKAPLDEDQIAVVDVLKEALAQALEGNISSVAVVACMKSGYATEMAGRQAADLFMACGSLQQRILAAVEGSGKSAQRRM